MILAKIRINFIKTETLQQIILKKLINKSKKFNITI